MSRKLGMVSVLMASFVVLAATSRTRAAPAAPENPPPVVNAEEMQEKVLPAVNMPQVPLSDFLDFVHELVPGFQYVIVRDAGVPADYPAIPAMALKKVTFGQVLSIIQEAFPGMEYHPVESEHGSVVFLFKIHGSLGADMGQVPQTDLRVYRLADAVETIAARHAPPVPPEVEADRLRAAQLNPVGGGGGGGNAANQAEAARAAAAEAARVLALRKATDAYDAAVKVSEKNALESVLSLIKAALAQSGDGVVTPVIQVHEESLTLILRGTPSQIGAVQKALEALTPEAVLAPLKEKFAETEHRYDSEMARNLDELARRNAELQAARAEVETLHEEMLKAQVSLEQLKVQLEAAKAKAETKDKQTKDK